MLTQCTHYLCTLIVKMPEKWLSSTCGNNNLRIISKPHAYLQIMTKASVKFRKNQHKNYTHKVPTTLGGMEGRTERKDGKTECQI